jgi:hypothetical protein
MDIITAWKKAKEGENIRGGEFIITKTNEFLSNAICGFSDESICSDSWEIERKPLVWEGEVRWATQNNYTVSPVSHTYKANESTNCNISDFKGKRTRIIITEIMEK